tara:strand:- start:312 stop:2222 length:1911 start_codon:yes stop_codon:yes gene_type:complete
MTLLKTKKLGTRKYNDLVLSLYNAKTAVFGTHPAKPEGMDTDDGDGEGSSGDINSVQKESKRLRDTAILIWKQSKLQLAYEVKRFGGLSILKGDTGVKPIPSEMRRRWKKKKELEEGSGIKGGLIARLLRKLLGKTWLKIKRLLKRIVGKRGIKLVRRLRRILRKWRVVGKRLRRNLLKPFRQTSRFIKSLPGKTASLLKRGAIGAWRGGKKLVTTGIEGAKNLGKNIWKSTEKVRNQAGDFIKRKKNDIGNFFQKKGDQLGDFAKRNKDKLFDWGKKKAGEGMDLLKAGKSNADKFFKNLKPKQVLKKLADTPLLKRLAKVASKGGARSIPVASAALAVNDIEKYRRMGGVKGWIGMTLASMDMAGDVGTLATAPAAATGVGAAVPAISQVISQIGGWGLTAFELGQVLLGGDPDAGSDGKKHKGFLGFNDGGKVVKPQLALVGEGGESEYIVPQSRLGWFVAPLIADVVESAVEQTEKDASKIHGHIDDSSEEVARSQVTDRDAVGVQFSWRPGKSFNASAHVKGVEVASHNRETWTKEGTVESTMRGLDSSIHRMNYDYENPIEDRILTARKELNMVDPDPEPDFTDIIPTLSNTLMIAQADPQLIPVPIDSGGNAVSRSNSFAVWGRKTEGN